MNPKCKKCSKTVYPMEKLNCLDSYWHKGCFRCEVCSLALNMKTYKGYNKLPYCNSHYPTTSFTSVADTPENMRIKKNTKLQSAVSYHAEYEKQKGSKISVSDDPDTKRVQQNTKNQSNVVYHGLQDQRQVEDYRRQLEKDQLAGTYNQDSPAAGGHSQPPVGTPNPPQNIGSLYDREQEQQSVPPPQPVAQPPAPASTGKQYQAIYDYAAADEDEISFSEGDLIVNAEVIDDGWMTGTVQRTGQTGMLPSNYVELL